MSGECTPIACSLGAGDLATRLEEWRALMATSVRHLDTDPRTVRLVLDDSERALLDAAALGQREKECCPFFDVWVELAAERRSLVLRVPEGAEDVLATFVVMLTS